MPEFPQPTSPRTVVATKMPANTFFIISYSFSFFDLYVYFRSRFIFDFYVNFNLALFSIFLFLCQFYFSGNFLETAFPASCRICTKITNTTTVKIISGVFIL